MLKIPSPDINDKLIAIFFFFADEQKGSKSSCFVGSELRVYARWSGWGWAICFC